MNAQNAQLVQTKKWFITHKTEAFIIKIVLGANLIALLAQVAIPMIPVPITGQTLGVTIVGFALGRKAGVAAILLYLYEGCIGLPVFAEGSSGFAKLMGPSGGYLYGFIASAWILGYFSDKKVLNNFWNSVAVAVLATVTTFAFGLIQLSYFVPEGTVLQYGLYPFIIGGAIKALLAAVLVVPAYKFVSKI